MHIYCSLNCNELRRVISIQRPLLDAVEMSHNDPAVSSVILFLHEMEIDSFFFPEFRASHCVFFMGVVNTIE